MDISPEVRTFANDRARLFYNLSIKSLHEFSKVNTVPPQQTRTKRERVFRILDRLPSLSASRYTLMTLPTNPQSDQTRSRVPVLQCRGKI